MLAFPFLTTSAVNWPGTILRSQSLGVNLGVTHNSAVACEWVGYENGLRLDKTFVFPFVYWECSHSSYISSRKIVAARRMLSTAIPNSTMKNSLFDL
jgi:hypothetical protein